MSKKPFKIFILLFFLVLSWSSVPDLTLVFGQDQKPTEYQVKAAFLYNLLQFIEWPTKSTKGQKPVLNLFIQGENPFGASLESYQGEFIQNKKLSIRKTFSLQDLKECHILFIAPSEKGRVQYNIKQANEMGFLTIGDTEGYAQLGVMINFYLEKNKVRFEINIDAARRAGIKISSELLKLARIIKDTP